MVKGKKPFIQTCKGFILYFCSMLVMLASYISLADRSHTLFGDSSTAGLTVGSKTILFPNGDVVYPGLTILLICILTALFARVLSKNLENYLFIVDSIDNRLLAAISILVAYITLVFIGIIFPYNNIAIVGRSLFSFPLVVVLAYVYQSFSIIFLSYVFFTPLYQDHMTDSNEVFLDNQWRYTQAFLSTILVGIVGITLPFSMEISEYFRVFGLLSTLGFLMAVPAAVIMFMLFRINEIEENIG